MEERPDEWFFWLFRDGGGDDEWVSERASERAVGWSQEAVGILQEKTWG